ncbi:MAG: hypothetical protein OSA92_12275 [Pirellulaceae bacterium]|jgi:hypothetical protein|nr:hypothetical protein [Pirellulaceae bacterium]|tara:strand:- start:2192 stop:2887 length:696 start_codon:yes stop_codon:yes gene_type:complete
MISNTDMTPIILNPWITAAWPGLSRLWLRGQWTGLALAAGFGVLFNLALTCQFMWIETVPSLSLDVIWSCVGLCWSIGAIDGFRIICKHATQLQIRRQFNRDYTNHTASETVSNAPPLLDPSDEHEAVASPDISDELFLDARNQYFKGNWFESESIINQILTESPHDIEARLLLITLLRHTNRIEKSLIQITEIQKWDNVKQWDFEIKRELELLELKLTSQNKSDFSSVAA